MINHAVTLALYRLLVLVPYFTDANDLPSLTTMVICERHLTLAYEPFSPQSEAEINVATNLIYEVWEVPVLHIMYIITFHELSRYHLDHILTCIVVTVSQEVSKVFFTFCNSTLNFLALICLLPLCFQLWYLLVLFWRPLLILSLVWFTLVLLWLSCGFWQYHYILITNMMFLCCKLSHHVTGCQDDDVHVWTSRQHHWTHLLILCQIWTSFGLCDKRPLFIIHIFIYSLLLTKLTLKLLYPLCGLIW